MGLAPARLRALRKSDEVSARLVREHETQLSIVMQHHIGQGQRHIIRYNFLQLRYE
jgi:hypothetical protein